MYQCTHLKQELKGALIQEQTIIVLAVTQGVNRAVGAHCGLVIDVEGFFFATGVNPV